MGDTCELSAERCELRVKLWFDIVMEYVQLLSSGKMDYNYWELDDLRARLGLFFLDASCLEVQDQKIL